MAEQICKHCGIRVITEFLSDSCQVCEDRAVLDGIASGLDEELAAVEQEGADTDHIMQVLASAADGIRKVANRQG